MPKSNFGMVKFLPAEQKDKVKIFFPLVNLIQDDVGEVMEMFLICEFI